MQTQPWLASAGYGHAMRRRNGTCAALATTLAFVLALGMPAELAVGSQVRVRTVDLASGDPGGDQGLIQVFRYIAAPKEANRLLVTQAPGNAGLIFTDRGAMQIEVKTRYCRRLDAHRVLCSDRDGVNGLGISEIRIALRDGRDRALLQSAQLASDNEGRPAVVLDGGSGADVLRAAVPFIAVLAGAGNDVIELSKVLRRTTPYRYAISCGPGRDRAVIGSPRYRVAPSCERVRARRRPSPSG